MTTFSITLGILAGLLQLVAYGIYGWHVLHDRIKPTAASWGIWALGAMLETVTYVFVTGDWVKNILPVVCALSAVTLFAFCVASSKFSGLSRWEWVLTVLDTMALFVWWFFQSAAYGNFLLVFTAVLSFVPLFLKTWSDPATENALPWALWSLAYLLMTITVLLRWEKAEDLVYPLTFLALHLFTAVAAVDVSRRRQLVEYLKTNFKPI
jgi:hypothetical protein